MLVSMRSARGSEILSLKIFFCRTEMFRFLKDITSSNITRKELERARALPPKMVQINPGLSQVLSEVANKHATEA